jgi:hypothetical protein
MSLESRAQVTPLGYSAADGALSALAALPGGGTVDALPEGTPYAGGGGASEILVSRDGKFRRGRCSHSDTTLYISLVILHTKCTGWG